MARLRGYVTITATFCYATQTDPQDPLNYTRAGLEVVFRPHDKKFTKTDRGPSKNPASKSFFSSGDQSVITVVPPPSKK